MITIKAILILEMVTILHLILAMMIWPSDESFPNYKASLILFVEVFTDGNCSNKLATLVKLPPLLFHKILLLNGTQNFACSSLQST